MTTRLNLAFGLWTIMTIASCFGRTVRGGLVPRRHLSFISPLQSLETVGVQQKWSRTDSIPWSAPTTIRHSLSFANAPKRRQSSLAASSIPLQEGDYVNISVNGENQQGIIKEVRGSGWYAVQVAGSDESVKVRGKQLSLVTTPEITDTVLSEDATFSDVVVPPPTIVDIDAALQSMSTDPVENKRDVEYLQQCAHHATFQQWIMFTDLHCSPSTLDTCLQVLQKVHDEAVQRKREFCFWETFGIIVPPFVSIYSMPSCKNCENGKFRAS